MDVVVGLFLTFGLLFFWGVWIFGYWLPMAKEHQRLFHEQTQREQRGSVERSTPAPPVPVAEKDCVA